MSSEQQSAATAHECTDACFAQPLCSVCGKRKAPRGRLVSDLMSLCTTECEGYRQEPQPGHRWASEKAGQETGL
jgi:hypothetical protein